MGKDITLFKNPESLYFQLIKKKDEIKNLDSDGILLDADEKECRRTIEFIKSKNKKIKMGVIGRDDSFNRRTLETLKIDYLISPEITEQKDSLKQRSSGLNHVLAKIAKSKNIAIVEDISLINYQKDSKRKARLISRIIQNIKICRKAKCEIKLATFALSERELLDEKQIHSIGFSLGMSSQQVKDCFNY
jgi:RNase P/RNase MRP subunit p30